MRALKFKVWDKDKKRMFEEAFELTGKGFTIWFQFEHMSSSNLVWLQFTGRQSIKGQDVYDGDVFIDQNGKERVVSYSDATAAFHAGIRGLEYKDSTYLSEVEIYEVTGNVNMQP